MMTSTAVLRNGILLFVAVALLVQSATASISRPPRNNDISTMADAMKYLQDLDTYYGDRARVRFGKRASLAQILRNRFTDSNSSNNNNADVARPMEFSPAEEPF